MQPNAFRLNHIVSCFDDEAGDPKLTDDLLRDLGLSREQIGETRTIDMRAEPRFLNAACAALDDPLFAARTGLRFKHSSNLNNYIAKHSKNLRKAVENSARYYAIFDPAFRYELHLSSNAASFKLICADPDFIAFHRHLEFLAFAFMERGRVLTDTNFNVLEMRFPHQPAWSTSRYSALAGCPVQFGAEHCEIIVPLWALETPIPTFDPNLRNYLMDYGDTLLRNMKTGEPSLRQQIKAALADRLPAHLASAAEIATSLGMSRRTLTRRLAEEELTFRIVVDELRVDLAKAYLSDGFCLAEIAFLLGYADQAAFTTAFKRWTGKSPGAWRSRR